MNSEVRAVESGFRATLDAWREHGADRLDPIRFHFMEALDRRAASHSGEARRILDAKLSRLIEKYAGDLENAELVTSDVDKSASYSLAGLVEYVSRSAAANADGRSSYPDMEMLEYFRKTWTQLSTERQFRQSLAQVPGNAGPLNSSSLVHRSLSLMRELSPGYLQQFMSYIDALSWMEQMNGGSAVPEKEAPRAGSPRKNTRSKPR
ncbi:DUF2894 domain-containing protein [Caballeronia sp. 15715]|uniref:DUF2894 domain-containing protein n=2 Tax=unclassified Caballeronia TaxID=2646786 RepID=UPI0039E5C111